MRKIVLQMMTTLNGRLDKPDVWVPSAGVPDNWESGIGDDQYGEIDRLYETYDTILVGHVTYQEMFAYWPGAETEEGGSETNKSMAHKMNTYKKYVFSRQGVKKALEWNNAELIPAASDDDILKFVTALKTQPGSDIHLSGGARLAQTFVRLGLVDEYYLFVYPVVSKGEAWFDQLGEMPEFDLVSAAPYKNGVVGLHYRPRRA